MADENILVINAGELIFQKGDSGGDLLFIEQGTVEIFTFRDHQEVILTEMSEGEIIGVMTCLTAEPRMASARAKSDVVVKKVAHQNIKKVLNKLPNWMGIVLKEFTIRLSEMNNHYSDSVLTNKQLENNQISSLFIAGQIACAFSATAPSMVTKINGVDAVVVEEVMDHLERVLNLERASLDRVFKVMLDTGLLKVELEEGKRRTIARMSGMERLAWFGQFVRETRSGWERKLVRTGFTNKDTRVLFATIKMAKRLGLDLKKCCELNTDELMRSMEKATGVRFIPEVMEKAAKLKLVEIDGTSPEQVVKFTPVDLSRIVSAVEAYRKLTNLDQKSGSERPKAA